MSHSQTYLLKKDSYGNSWSPYSVDDIINEAVDKAVKQSHDALCDEKDGIATMNQIIDRRIASDVKPMIMDCVDAIDLLETNCDVRLDALEISIEEKNEEIKNINTSIDELNYKTAEIENDVADLKLANDQNINKFTNIDQRFKAVDTTYLKKADTNNVITTFLTTNIFDVVNNQAFLKEQFLARYDASIKNTYLTKTDATSTYQTIIDTNYKYNELKTEISTKPTFKQIEDTFYSNQSAQDLISQVNSLIQQVKELKVKVETLENANKTHTEDINKLQGDVEKVNLENNQFQELIDSIGTDLTANNKIDETQNQQIVEIKQDIEKVNLENNNLKQLINWLRSDLTANQEVDNSQNQQIDEIKQDIQEIENDVGDNKADIETIEDNVKTHSQRIEEISETVVRHDSAISQLEDEVFNV